MKVILTNRKTARLGLAATVLTLSTILGFNCSPFAVQPIVNGNFGSSSDESSVTEPQPTVALLSSEQILKAMIAATGTENAGEPTPDDDLIKSTYEARSGSFPSDQSLTLATGPMMISVTNLASAVCNKAVNRDIATGEAQRDQRLFFREMDFSKGLSAQSSDSISLAFDRLVKNAWRRAASQAEENAIVDFAQEFSRESNANDPQQTRLLAVSICSAVLSSVDALTY